MDTSRDFERYAAIAAILLLAMGCYLVLRPFLTAFLWGGIIAVSTRGIYARLLGALGGRRGLAATLTGLGLAAILLVPIATLGLDLAGRLPKLTQRFTELSEGEIPGPPDWVAEMPLIGDSVSNYWEELAAHPDRITQDLRPLLRPVRDFLVEFSAGFGSGILEFILALVMACLLYVWGDDLGRVLNQVALRLGGDAGSRQMAVISSTVRGVFRGVVGTSAIQALLAVIGFWLAGVPGVLLLGIGTFFLSLIPGGPALLWIPATVWLYTQGAHGWAIFMVLWGGIVVGSSDNVLRPLLIGKGVSAPMGLIFIGVLGGVLAFGFLGLFIGPTLLAVGFNLFQDWMSTQTPVRPDEA